MPACHTGAKKDSESYVENSWRACLDGKVKEGSKKVKLHKFMADEICRHVWTDVGLEIPANWTRQVAEYVHDGTPITGIKDEVEINADMGWLDKHVCPWDHWNSESISRNRLAYGKMCKYNLDEQNLELLAFTLYEKWNTEPDPDVLDSVGISEKFKDLLITRLTSSESMQASYSAKIMNLGSTTSSASAAPNGLPDTNYTVEWPNDYITIVYRDSAGNPTGRLKIITMNSIYTF